jgi:peptidyl-tRNA hydrolase, PTH1 family
VTRDQSTYLIAGLGNPGLKYAGNRHNVGFRCVQRLAEAHGVSFDKTQKHARVGRGFIGADSVVLVLPQTFMNKSGVAVAALVQFYKVPLDHVLVVYDDLDLPLGSIRLRKAGGSGGHKGMQSIIQCLGDSRDFSRLRIGIGRPPGQMDPAAYVLRDFASDQTILLDETLSQAVDGIETWLTDGIEIAMTRHNQST